MNSKGSGGVQAADEYGGATSLNYNDGVALRSSDRFRRRLKAYGRTFDYYNSSAMAKKKKKKPKARTTSAHIAKMLRPGEDGPLRRRKRNFDANYTSDLSIPGNIKSDDGVALVEEEEEGPSGTVIVKLPESETEQKFDATPLTLQSVLSSPMNDWIRQSITYGINSVVKLIWTVDSPHELQVKRLSVFQSLDTLQAMANPNNVDLTWFTSRVQELFDVTEALTAKANTVTSKRVEKLSADLAQRCTHLSSKQAELPQLPQESLCIKEQAAQIKKMEADLAIRKTRLETKSADLHSSIQQCENEIQQLRYELDQAGQARVEELNANKSRLHDLISNLTTFAPPH